MRTWFFCGIAAIGLGFFGVLVGHYGPRLVRHFSARELPAIDLSCLSPEVLQERISLDGFRDTITVGWLIFGLFGDDAPPQGFDIHVDQAAQAVLGVAVPLDGRDHMTREAALLAIFAAAQDAGYTVTPTDTGCVFRILDRRATGQD